MKRFFLSPAILGLALGCLFPQNVSANLKNSWSLVKGRIIFGGMNILVPQPINPGIILPVQLRGPLINQEVLVNPQNRGIKNVFVWLEPEPGNPPLRIHPDFQRILQKEVEVQFRNFLIVPYCVALREGQVLVAKNPGLAQHNFRWTGHPLKNPGGNQNMIPGNIWKIELKADTFPVLMQCDIYPWIKGWIRIFDHPYFALTDDNGEFAMPKAPSGNYRLKVWHPASGWLGGGKGKMGMRISINPGPVTHLGALKLVQ